MVVEENSVKELPFTPAKKLYVVKQEVGPAPRLIPGCNMCVNGISQSDAYSSFSIPGCNMCRHKTTVCLS